MIELIVYAKGDNPQLISNSPFCSKTEIFLKLAKIDFKITEFNDNPSKFPKAKLPVIKHDNKIIGDSLRWEYKSCTFYIITRLILSTGDLSK